MRVIRLLAAGAAFAAALSAVAMAQDAKIEIPTQKLDKQLQAKLPEDIRKAGEMTSVNNGSFPPYEIVTDKGMEGASGDFAKALGELLGIKIKHASVQGFSALLSGIQSGRFQFALGPIGDFKSREKSHDFIDYVQEYVVFAVQKGNPKKIDSLADACGDRIAVMAGGSAERVVKAQSEKCKKEGKPAVTVQSFNDQPTSILAVRSKRSDGFFSSQAPLTYFVQQAHGDLQLAGVGKPNGFHDLFQGAVVKKGSPLAGVLLEGFTVLEKNGTYAKIMQKWGLKNNMLSEPAVNKAEN